MKLALKRVVAVRMAEEVPERFDALNRKLAARSSHEALLLEMANCSDCAFSCRPGHLRQFPVSHGEGRSKLLT